MEPMEHSTSMVNYCMTWILVEQSLSSVVCPMSIFPGFNKYFQIMVIQIFLVGFSSPKNNMSKRHTCETMNCKEKGEIIRQEGQDGVIKSETVKA